MDWLEVLQKLRNMQGDFVKEKGYLEEDAHKFITCLLEVICSVRSIEEAGFG